jgi:hypothetical protein
LQKGGGGEAAFRKANKANALLSVNLWCAAQLIKGGYVKILQRNMKG